MDMKFKQAVPVIEKIEQAGFEAYLLAVRYGILLNKPIDDVDIATSAFPEEIKSIFPNHRCRDSAWHRCRFI